jgi:hypothetical protein
MMGVVQNAHRFAAIGNRSQALGTRLRYEVWVGQLLKHSIAADAPGFLIVVELSID